LFCLCTSLPGLLPCLCCTTQATNIHASGGIRTRNPIMRSSAHPRLRYRPPAVFILVAKIYRLRELSEESSKI
jgi:hypothetical protein